MLWRLYKERGASSGLAATEQRLSIFSASGYTKEESLGYVYLKPHQGAIPLYEFAVPPNGKTSANDVLWFGKDMLYSTQADEIRSVLALNPDTYVGICCYVPGNVPDGETLSLPSKTIVAPQERWFTQIFAGGKSRGQIAIPDILGYKTLKGDFHMHTVFSDGDVWPDVRANEIWGEGLDVFAVTDHIEFRPHSSDISGSLNRSSDIAVTKANELGIIGIRAAEITKDFPNKPLSAHFNTIFAKDIDRIASADLTASLEEAKAQGAFVFWSHPPENWPPEMDSIFSNGLIQGLEIVNGGDYSNPTVFRWANEKGLTVLANTDMHEPVVLRAGQHRQMTLVFAKERTEDSVRDALENGRTLAYYGSYLAGAPLYLDAIFRGSVSFSPALATIGKGPTTVQIKNTSDIPFQITNISSVAFSTNVTSLSVPAKGKTSVTLTIKDPLAKDKNLEFRVTNLLAGPDLALKVKVK